MDGSHYIRDERKLLLKQPKRAWDGQALRRRRRAAGLTVEQLAKLLKIHRGTIYKWEGGFAKLDYVRCLGIWVILKQAMEERYAAHSTREWDKDTDDHGLVVHDG